MKLRESVGEVLEDIFQRGYKHGVSVGQSDDGEFYAVDFGCDRILKLVEERLPKDKRQLDCYCMVGESCGCAVDDYNQALTDVRKGLGL